MVEDGLHIQRVEDLNALGRPRHTVLEQMSLERSKARGHDRRLRFSTTLAVLEEQFTEYAEERGGLMCVEGLHLAEDEGVEVQLYRDIHLLYLF